MEIMKDGEHVIPPAVIEAARPRMEYFNVDVKYLGTRKGRAFYTCLMPRGNVYGFPHVYVYENGDVNTLSGFDAIAALRPFRRTLEAFRLSQ